jgi:hypothetical protein
MLIILTILISSVFSQGINPGGASGTNNTGINNTRTSNNFTSSSNAPISPSNALINPSNAPISPSNAPISSSNAPISPSYTSTVVQIIKFTETPYLSNLSPSSMISFNYQTSTLSFSSSASYLPSPSYLPSASYLPSVSYSPNSSSSLGSVSSTPNPLINLNMNSNNDMNNNYIIGASCFGAIVFLIIIINLCYYKNELFCKKIDTLPLTNVTKEIIPKKGHNIINHNPISAYIPPLKTPVNKVVEWSKCSDGKDVWYVSSEGETTWILPQGAILIDAKNIW